MSFLPPKHDNSTPPISNWPNGWGRHSFLFSGAQHGTGWREFGLRTSSTGTEAFGLWMKAWRRPPRQRALLACAYSTPANSMWGLGSSCRRMRRQPNSVPPILTGLWNRRSTRRRRETMKVGVIGSGVVAQTLGAGFLKHGHEVA